MNKLRKLIFRWKMSGNHFLFSFFRCDRIIWYGKGLKQHLYTRSELKVSDHRPVKAIFTAEVGVLQTLKGFQSFFLSDRIERLSSHLELSSSDDILCKGRSSFQL